MMVWNENFEIEFWYFLNVNYFVSMLFVIMRLILERFGVFIYFIEL